MASTVWAKQNAVVQAMGNFERGPRVSSGSQTDLDPWMQGFVKDTRALVRALMEYTIALDDQIDQLKKKR